MRIVGDRHAFFLTLSGIVLAGLVVLGAVDPATSVGAGSKGDRTLAIGDTLTVIQRPLVNIPAIARPGDVIPIECEADPGASGWTAWITCGDVQVPLTIAASSYDPSTLWWTLHAEIPSVPVYELYDLWVAADGGIEDQTWNAVRVIPAFRDDYYFIHITDSHLPTKLYNYQTGADDDSSEVVDLREVMSDINVMNPEFVVFTGDIINEGELEDYLGWRVYTRTQALLNESDVPIYCTSGNHDIGGWDSTPPPDGTARRDWWRFFGWKRLNDPPAGAPWYTQNYSFDYGTVHYVGMEAYINYDNWRSYIYGNDSFTPGQMDWLDDDLAAASGASAEVLFYHIDFSDQINLSSLGVEMALWGHIHGDQGSIYTTPYNLGTNNVCSGERAYRVIYVSDGVLQPTHTISAGYSGQNFRVQYSPANDGSNYEVTAQITNNHSRRFEHGLIRFVMPADSGNPQVVGGILQQVDSSGDLPVYYVNVDILASGSQSVTLTTDPVTTRVASEQMDADRLWLGQNYPNPFNPSTMLTYAIPQTGRARLSIYDVQGREVNVLLDGLQTAGEHTVEWNGRDLHGNSAVSGVYIIRLEVGGQVRTRKLVLAR
jgi:hypothetical protein